MKLSEKIRARAKGYTTESVNFQWIEAGIIIQWADHAAEVEKELAVRNTVLRRIVEAHYPPKDWRATEDILLQQAREEADRDSCRFLDVSCSYGGRP